MEEYKKVPSISYQELIRVIVDSVREKAATIPPFAQSHNGCIRIGLMPLNRWAEDWLCGGLSSEQDTCLREFVYPIFPGGSHTIQWSSPQDGHVEPVNCYAYSALKVAGLMWRRQHGLDNPTLPEQLQYLTEDNGWSQNKGALDSLVRVDREDFLWLYICVSGATSDEDRRCAFKGLIAARDTLRFHSAVPLSWNVRIP